MKIEKGIREENFQLLKNVSKVQFRIDKKGGGKVLIYGGVTHILFAEML